jgi:hypothetical protein
VRVLLVLLLLALPTVDQTVVSRGAVVKSRTLVGQAIRVTKQSSSEWRILTPVVGAPQTYQAEWRFKVSQTTPVSASGPMWFLLGLYGRDLAVPGDVQLSTSDDGSVYEYVGMVGVTDAPAGGFDFMGNGHGGEQLSAPISFVLDGRDISSFSVGSTQDGLSLVVTQAKTFQLPKNPDGSSNYVTQIGTGTTTHTFNTTGMKVNHTHTFIAGYQGHTWYAAMIPSNFDNFNRARCDALSGGVQYTPVGDSSTQFTGLECHTISVWHESAHRFKVTMNLTSGGPAVPSDWSHAGPGYTYWVDDPARGKGYSLFINGAYASRIALSPLGTITQEQQYSVDYRP